jgi:segregation and condensation protein B
MTLKQVVEALVFASPKPISTGEIVEALRAAGNETPDELTRGHASAKAAAVEAALAELRDEYAQAGHAFQLVENVNGWSLSTTTAAAPWIRQLYPEAKPTRLTGPQLETLAIVAYRQPVTRADIEAVRGVAVDGVMQVLLDRGLVRISGRAEVPGRPLLYQTTEYFLQHFGLKTVDDLPNASELKRVALPAAPRPHQERAADAAAQPASADAGKSDQAQSEEATAEDRNAPAPATAPHSFVP